MIVLHAGVLEGQFFLWGEIPVGQKPPLDKKARRKKDHGSSSSFLKPFPYDAGAEKLSDALKEAGLGLKVSKRFTEPMIAYLPTVDRQPVPSSPLIAEAPEGDEEALLVPWTVTGFCLSAKQVVEFLCACVGKQTLAPGVIVSKDLTFWTTAMRFAGALVAKQQFLPGLNEDNGIYLARWRAVFSGLNAERLSKLAKTMPAVSRALAREEKQRDVSLSAPQSPSSISVLSGFIDETVDHLVRSSISPVGAGLKPAPPPERQHKKKPCAFESLHDQWLHKLRSPDGVMEGASAELARFAAQVQEWQRPISLSADAPFRLCFRLEEPKEDGNGDKSWVRGALSAKEPISSWYVRYLLQAAHDPSLLITAQNIWSSKDQAALKSVFSSIGRFNAREHLLLSLGQALGICPRIEASLKTSTPGGYELDAIGAYEFLTEKALSLEQAGFGMMLPAWWTRKGTKLLLTARANVKTPKSESTRTEMQGSSGLSLDQLVQFDWELALGKEKLSIEELRALVRLKAPLIKIRGQWVQINAEEIKAALEFWKKKGEGQATVREIIQMALGAKKMLGNITFEGITATGWIANLLTQLEGRHTFEELTSPQGFQGTLRPYQVRGYSWLSFLRQWGLGACLADDMGLGKTIQALALIQRDWQLETKRPALLICPTSVVSNWQKEASRFTPELPVMVHHGIARTKGKEFKKSALKHAIVISSYALAHRDFETLKEVQWAGVVLDEAQNIKNPETKQSKAARAFKGDYRIALTGTPVENNVGDLWSIMEFLNPNFLGTQTEFKKRFFIPIQAGRDPEAVEQLKRLTGPFILRRLKTDKAVIADLPEKMEMKVFCTLTKEQASLYEAVVKETIENIDSTEGIQRKGMVLATLSKLKQICNHPAQFLGDHSPIPGRSGKLTRLTEMIEEMVEVGDRALVFSQFAEMGEILRRHLQETFGREALFLYGAVPREKRDRMIERFQSDEDGPHIFILSLKAGGTGLNLTRASRVVHFDRWWNPAVENQATDRAFRIGQTKNVQVHKFLCAGTLEEKIDEMIERKKEIAEGVIGTGESWLTELSTVELKNLFALRREAVGE
ncbi:MAG: DEAD/DEAH box helicase [Deltaproteobacteria bacterium]|nr:DEAD/DEAH box helicase [Deltaproteobacteria bacterium]